MKLSALLSSLPFILLAGCHSATSTQTELASVPAIVLTVAAQSRQNGVSLSGVVHPTAEADISAQVMAPIAAITKHQGDMVRRGEVLVRLRVPALDAGVAQAKAAVLAAQQQSSAAQIQAKLAADTLGRYHQLSEHHSVTPHELDEMQAQNAAADAQQQTAKAQVAAAEAALAVQHANAADAVLTAPFDGVVTQRFADPGALAVPGSPILHIQSAGRSEVQFSIPVESLTVLHAGSSVEVRYQNETMNAIISSISPAGDAASHSFLVKAALPATTKWNAGTIVNVLIPSPKPTSILAIPASALVQQGGLDAVLVLTSDNHAEVRYVTLGQKTEDAVQVLTGLKTGDRVLAQGHLDIAGRAIEVR